MPNHQRFEAARRLERYAKRRRWPAPRGPKRLLADFIIGSHALAQADRSLTLDPKRYERDFPELKFICDFVRSTAAEWASLAEILRENVSG